MIRTALALVIVILAHALPALAQASAPGGCNVKWQATSQDAIGINENHYRLLRNVQIDCNDMQLFADEAEIFSDADRMRASGNVLFVSPGNRVSAERMEFNTRTKTGTFYIASGIANMENRGIDRSLFGTQEPDAYFWGETIEKLGPKTYRITRGGFTTCVQPTPRWELVSGSAVVTLERHAVLKNTMLMVKGVPFFYLPVMYYPISKEDRATGFLIPTYGASNVRGQTINNAFFWAINRSQDATFYHDYFSKTGMGFGGEYRYVQAPGSQGNFRMYLLREHDTSYRQANGTEVPYKGRQSYEIRGSLQQKLSTVWRMSGNANYFSSLATQQRYQHDLAAATNTIRSYGVNLSGNWGGNTLSVTQDRSEYLYGENVSSVYGSFPRVTFTRADSRLGSLPVYVGLNSEFVELLRTQRSGTTESDLGLGRVDFFPTVRIPFTKIPFLTFNSTIGFRETYWTQSLDRSGTQVRQSINRRYTTMASTITGPVFTRVFSTPKRQYAQKFKHVIEPTFTVQRITAIENYSHIVRYEAADYVVGDVTSIAYGLNNRLYAKRDSAREILMVSLSQHYYTNGLASTYDQQFASTFVSGLKPSNFSPIALQVRASPWQDVDGVFRAEWDAHVHALRTISASGGISKAWVQATAGWSQRRYIPNLPGYDILANALQAINSATVVHKPGNAFGGSFSINYNPAARQFLNYRWMAYYNSQCCGITAEYQKFTFGQTVAAFGLPSDHRFNISFTLAGIGSFSNMLGSFGGAQSR